MGIDVLLGVWLAVAGWLPWTPPASAPAATAPLGAMTSTATVSGGGSATGTTGDTTDALGSCEPASECSELRPGSDPLG